MPERALSDCQAPLQVLERMGGKTELPGTDPEINQEVQYQPA